MKTAREFMVTKLVTLDPEAPVLHSIPTSYIHVNIKGAPVVWPGRRYGDLHRALLPQGAVELTDRLSSARPTSGSVLLSSGRPG